MIIKLIIILLLVYYIMFQKEKFNQNASCNIINDKCRFVPRGVSLKDCMTQCENSTIKTLYDEGNYCDNVNCYNICKYCDNLDRCQWLNNIEKCEDKTLINFNLSEINNIGILENYTPNFNFDIYKEDNKLNWEDINEIDVYLVNYVKLSDKKKINIIYTTNNYTEITNRYEDSDKIFLETGIDYLFIIYGVSNNKLKYISNSQIINIIN